MSNSYESVLNHIELHGYEFRFVEYFKNGFRLFKKYPFGFLSYGINISLVIYFSGFLGIPGSIISNLLQPVFLAGIYIVANDLLREQTPGYTRFFSGFEQFAKLFVAQIVTFSLVFLGLLLLVLPGIYLAVCYSFTVFFIVFMKYDYRKAMDWSRKIVRINFWPVLGFMLVIGLINVLGALAFGIGLAFTLPFTACVMFSAFEDVISTAAEKTGGVGEY
ncbi:MAG: hypothetical protein KBB11_05835 [Bacteroidales bacterium]|nr:hypothetical protein [Bacteroidales bacterium]HOY37928.1 hypothetical protein [Bacteroidales bacterium]HQP03514.1 hypothetical protein [Bacteroidales bacterium]